MGGHNRECTCDECLADCECEFDPYEFAPDGGPLTGPPEESFHFRRTCSVCGNVWWSFHCAHDGVQSPCRVCGFRPPGTETPMEFLGFAAPPGGRARLSD